MKFKILALFLFLFFSGCSREIVIEKEQVDKGGGVINVEDNWENKSKENYRLEEIGEIVSFKELLDKNKNLKCFWEIEKEEIDQDAEVENIDEEIFGGIEEGEIYISANNFLQKIKIQENSQKIVVNILKKGDWIYQWSSISKQGTKMTLDKAQSTKKIDLNKKLNFNCENMENLKEGFFELPLDIKFIQF